jgi:hypothetical protein
MTTANTTRRYHIVLKGPAPHVSRGNPQGQVLADMWIDWEPQDPQGLHRRIDAYITRSNAQRQRRGQDLIETYHIITN